LEKVKGGRFLGHSVCIRTGFTLCNSEKLSKIHITSRYQFIGKAIKHQCHRTWRSLGIKSAVVVKRMITGLWNIVQIVSAKCHLLKSRIGQRSRSQSQPVSQSANELALLNRQSHHLQANCWTVFISFRFREYSSRSPVERLQTSRASTSGLVEWLQFALKFR